jgi:anti-sigma factor RsiW
MDDDACRQLDAYLNRELSGADQRNFFAHLATCPACRDAVDRQQWIDDLLRSDEAATIESASETVALPTVRVQRRRRLALAAVAATIAAIAVSLFPVARRDASNRARSPVATVRRAGAVPRGDAELTATVPSIPGKGAPASAAFVGEGSSIVIPVASDDPQVTIVQLYSTTTASRRWAREASLRANALPHNGG